MKKEITITEYTRNNGEVFYCASYKETSKFLIFFNWTNHYCVSQDKLYLNGQGHWSLGEEYKTRLEARQAASRAVDNKLLSDKIKQGRYIKSKRVV